MMEGRDALALMFRQHFGRQCGQRSRGGRVVECTETDCVDAVRQILERLVPRERDRSPPGDHLVSVRIDDEELEVGVLREQRPEVAASVVAVMVVFGPYATEAIVGHHRCPQVGTFGSGDHGTPVG